MQFGHLLLFGVVSTINFVILYHFFPNKSVIDSSVAVLFAPLFEEFMFRGYLFETVKGNAKVKICITAALFALWHIKNFFLNHSPAVDTGLEMVQVMLIIGPFFGWLRYRYGSLFPSMVAHSIYNTAATFLFPFALPLMLAIWLGLAWQAKLTHFRYKG